MQPSTIKNWQQFRVIGLNSPMACDTKQFLFTPVITDETIAIVLLDIVRCSTTLSVAMAKGVDAVVVTQKQTGAGCTRYMAEAICQTLKLDRVIEGGELHGKAIPGASLSNSPLEASKADHLQQTVLRFASTNFGAMYFKVTSIAQKQIEQGCKVEIFVANAFNTDLIANAIKSSHRVFFCCGGFYDSSSLEDLAVAGQIIEQAGFGLHELDDEARAMVAVSRLASEQKDISLFKNNAIGRCLQAFGKADDIAAAIEGKGLCPLVKRRLGNLLPKVRFIDTKLAGMVPTIVPSYVSNPVIYLETAKKTIFAEDDINALALKYNQAA